MICNNVTCYVLWVHDDVYLSQTTATGYATNVYIVVVNTICLGQYNTIKPKPPAKAKQIGVNAPIYATQYNTTRSGMCYCGRGTCSL